MAVYPLPSYPGKTQEALLGQLLRKKLEPEVEDWVTQGLQVAELAGMADDGKRSGVLDLWSWAGMAANELARGHEWGGDFTLEEREGGIENVVTGLKRKFVEVDEDEDEDEEEDENEDDDDDDAAGKDKMEALKVDRAAEDVGLKTAVGQEDEDIGSRVIGDPLPLEHVLKFMMTGIEPKI
jgi:mediator of RNA polymerase II transcription subunit 8